MEKSTLTLSKTEIEGIKSGIKSNGVKYSVRDYRNRYFFPDEWKSFYKQINPKYFIFDVLINTGARIEEALCIKVNHIRFDRNYLTLYVTKIKSKKGETKPSPRDIVFSQEFGRRLKKYIELNKLKDTDYLFINQKEYPTRKDLKKETTNKKVAISQMMKRALKESGIKDWYMFSLHNIRKTHGMWLKALDVKFEEICKRLGHDANTYLKHYGSADIFNRQDKQEMIKILGGIYGTG
jgi:integrase